MPYNVERVFFESGLGMYTQYFTLARALVRWADESAKPNGQRLPEYTDARKAQLERQMASTAPIYPGVEQAKLAACLTVMAQKLGADHALVKQILAGKSPADRAAELVAGTKMGDAATRTALLAGGKAAVDASSDPMIALAKLIDPRARELRTRYDNEVLGVERDGYAKIAQAVFAVKGDSAYPDGTFTLRLSYGAVKGYMENGKMVTPFTEIRGLYVRGDEHEQKPPYKIADSWMKARGSIKPTTPYNFVSTNDIVGGNSGSPVINAKGELVGLIFDGNIQSLPGYFVYDSAVNRAVSVDSRGILEALKSVYKADAIVSELTRAAAVKELRAVAVAARMTRLAPLPRSVKLLGWVSLLTDAATEAVYPLLPVFVTQVLGGPPIALGIVEGAADATSSVLKVFAGRWSDRLGARKPIVVAGYALSSLVRPFIALATSWAHVFAIRVTDRVGKGLRSAPRDAMLAALAPPGERGRVFGYHWAMDHAGAAVGPLLATVFLYFSPDRVPPAVRPDDHPRRARRDDAAAGAGDWHPHCQLPEAPTAPAGAEPLVPTVPLPRPLKKYLVILSVFTLGQFVRRVSAAAAIERGRAVDGTDRAVERAACRQGAAGDEGRHAVGSLRPPRADHRRLVDLCRRLRRLRLEPVGPGADRMVPGLQRLRGRGGREREGAHRRPHARRAARDRVRLARGGAGHRRAGGRHFVRLDLAVLRRARRVPDRAPLARRSRAAARR